MSKSELPPLPLVEAEALAQELMRLLMPGCKLLTTAGSIRRRKPLVNDIELVALPDEVPALDLFGFPIKGQTDSNLTPILAELGLTYTKNGPKYKQFTYGGRTVDLFLPDANTWGWTLTLRTGSADFTKWLVTEKAKGGAKPRHLSFSEGRIWNGLVPFETPEEADVFRILELEWIPPEARTDGRWKGRGSRD